MFAKNKERDVVLARALRFVRSKEGGRGSSPFVNARGRVAGIVKSIQREWQVATDGENASLRDTTGRHGAAGS